MSCFQAFAFKVNLCRYAKAMQVYLTGFLEKNCSLFMRELWAQLASAQAHPSGIPQFFIDEKQREVDEARAAKVEQERLSIEATDYARWDCTRVSCFTTKVFCYQMYIVAWKQMNSYKLNPLDPQLESNLVSTLEPSGEKPVSSLCFQIRLVPLQLGG
jgi:hypothetical protein